MACLRLLEQRVQIIFAAAQRAGEFFNHIIFSLLRSVGKKYILLFLTEGLDLGLLEPPSCHLKVEFLKSQKIYALHAHPRSTFVFQGHDLPNSTLLAAKPNAEPGSKYSEHVTGEMESQ